MKEISVCIDMMFQRYEFFDRVSAVKKCNLHNVEFWKWTNKNLEKLEMLLQELNMNVTVFNIDSKDEKLSYDLSRGILNAGRVDDFLKALKESIPVYKKLRASALIVLIGEHDLYCEENIYRCLEAAKPLLEENSVNLVIEPLNNIDRIGYSMPYAAPIFALLRKLNSPYIKMLYDIYHQNMMGDFSLEEIRKNIDLIGHFHVADVPGRHEPGTGNLNYKYILNEIMRLPYEGSIGLEYRSIKKDEETLTFLKEVNICD